MTKSTDKRSVRSRESFYHALIELMKEKDYERITVTELIERSGYSRTAFYSNFYDKEDCLTSLVDQQAELFYDHFRQQVEITAKPYETWTTEAGNIYEMLFRAPYELVYANKDIYVTVYHSLGDKWIDYFLHKVMRMVSEGLSFNAIGRESDQINTELWMWSHIWDTLGRIAFWIKHGLNYSPEYMGRQQYLKRIDGSYLILDAEKS